MTHSPIWIGNSLSQEARSSVTGEFLTVHGEPFYRIQHFDQMAPFFMSIVSDSDHWMFVSSLGALSAGRKNPDHALFPYTTVDKIHDSADLTGSKTLLLVKRNGKTYLWEPFSKRYQGVYACTQNLYKSVYGDKIRFESINEDLGIRFSYLWGTSERFGFVKQSEVEAVGKGDVSLSILDGIQNLLHYGVERGMQNERSNLLDAYKKNELDVDSGVGLFALSSLVVDKPIPSEALRATTVWCAGIEPDAYLVSMRQLDRFRRTGTVETELDVRAERGGYFVHKEVDLEASSVVGWSIIAEINQGPEAVAALIDGVTSGDGMVEEVEASIQEGTQQLKRLVGSADGMQVTADAMTATRHYSNVLFNIMRGGVFDNNTLIDRDDVRFVLSHFNRPVAQRNAGLLAELPIQIEVGALLNKVAETGDRQLERLCYEYLPLIFSRRHGDPSRPWNMFSIDLRDEQGALQRSYQGNWRDIFQNWEALCLSFPSFTESIISKFVNASTVDGYNPYRITRNGIDWEILDPEDPWSYIGYWGDHQIIYLLKLLEISRDHHPDQLSRMLTHNIFAYANVPYRIKPYAELLADPHNTIVYDEEEEERIAARIDRIGADGKLIMDDRGEVCLVNLTEKLLVSVLSKLANFIPGGGIWMNTQRPEWNDANNALVGYGVSMVTLYYLRRFNQFMAELLSGLGDVDIEISEEVEFYWASIEDALHQYGPLLQGAISDHHRKDILDALGEAGSSYRMLVYNRGFSGQKNIISADQLTAFFELTLEYIDHTIRENQRGDRLFHAYNLMHVSDNGISISHLYEMLEGQVAVLSAGILSAEQTVDVLAALKRSALYREDQNSYVLYPDRTLARFTDKNKIPEEAIKQSALLSKLVQDEDASLIVKNLRGDYHFSGHIKDREAVDGSLTSLASNGYKEDVDREREEIQALYTSVFGHTTYTGRSGTFYGYEGLGCIYWHMVSKMVLAINESYFRFHSEGVGKETLGRLVEAYYDVRAGIGLNKPPDVYGAFPFDPYSHTPGHAGARQPGMTGQVKEDIISRWGELGVTVQHGHIRIAPFLLRAEEFLASSGAFAYTDLQGVHHELQLDPGTIAFTYCQVPFVYRIAEEPGILVIYEAGDSVKSEGLQCSPEVSDCILHRKGGIRSVHIDIPQEMMLQ